MFNNSVDVQSSGVIHNISISLLSAGGINSLQTMTLVTALPFGIIMLILCICLFKALRTDELYRSTKIPYGSRSWDGRQWRERLQQILTFSQKKDILRFFSEQVRPAFEELQTELAKKREYSISPLPIYSDGRTGNDIQYLSRDEIIADVLREYERYLSIIADEDKSMIYIDKKKR